MCLRIKPQTLNKVFYKAIGMKNIGQEVRYGGIAVTKKKVADPWSDFSDGWRQT